MVKEAVLWSGSDPGPKYLMMSWGGMLYNALCPKPHRVHALRPQVISGPGRQFSLRHLGKKKTLHARAKFSRQFKKFRGYNQMHTWLCCLTTFINRHDSSLLLGRKHTLEHEVGFKLHVSEIYTFFFLFLHGESAKVQRAMSKHKKWSRNNCVSSATIATVHTQRRTLESIQWR